MQNFLTDGQGQLSNFFFQPRHGVQCPEPIPIVYIIPGPAALEELDQVRQHFAPPPTPYTSRAASRPSDYNENLDLLGQREALSRCTILRGVTRSLLFCHLDQFLQFVITQFCGVEGHVAN